MKKNHIQIFFVLLAAIVLFNACNKDEDTNDEPEAKDELNVIYYGNDEYPIEDAFFSYYGPDEEFDGYYGLDLVLHTSGIKYDEEKFLAGKGTFIWFYFYIKDSAELLPNTYNYVDNADDMLNTFEVEINIEDDRDDDNHEGENNWDFNTGTLTVEKDGDEYTLTFTGKAENNRNVSFTYKGTLPIYDWSDFEY